MSDAQALYLVGHELQDEHGTVVKTVTEEIRREIVRMVRMHDDAQGTRAADETRLAPILESARRRLEGVVIDDETRSRVDAITARAREEARPIVDARLASVDVDVAPGERLRIR